MLNRRSRMLLLSALILTVVFIFLMTSGNVTAGGDLGLSQAGTGATKAEMRQKEEVELKLKDSDNLNDVVRNPKNGEIDESKVKQAEEIMSAQKNGGGTPREILKQQNVQGGENNAVAAAGGQGVAAGSDSSAGSIASADDFDPAKEFKQIMSVSPVVMFSKTYCPYSKALKQLLKTQYIITPEPAIVELDKHENGALLQLYIGEKSGRHTVPNLFINGVSRGGSDDMHALHTANDLLLKLTDWGGKSISVDKVNAPSNS